MKSIYRYIYDIIPATEYYIDMTLTPLYLEHKKSNKYIINTDKYEIFNELFKIKAGISKDNNVFYEMKIINDNLLLLNYDIYMFIEYINKYINDTVLLFIDKYSNKYNTYNNYDINYMIKNMNKDILIILFTNSIQSKDIEVLKYTKFININNRYAYDINNINYNGCLMSNMDIFI